MKKVIVSFLLILVSYHGLTYIYHEQGSNVNANNGNSAESGDDRAAGCAPPSERLFMQFNNVKALIEVGGLMWQNRAANAPSYEVPKDIGRFVIFAGALWMGGTDVNGQLKLAAQRFGQGRDFWGGPLSTFGGAPGNYNPAVQQSSDLNVIRPYGDAEIIPEQCAKYDEFFTVQKSKVRKFIVWWNCENGILSPDDCSDVEPLTADELNKIINWPAHGDPALGQDYYLAPFYDNPNAPGGANGYYDPINDGDYPWYDFNEEIDCRNDRRVTLYGDETNWWVFNDKGNIHTETGGDPIGMEIRAQAFAFATNDAINDMTFYNYELINRGTQTLFNTYFAQYVDADIGGAFDDYVGCDVERGLGYAFNGDANDEGGSGSLGWGANAPAIGVDFFEGPYQDLDGIDNPLTTNIQHAIDSLGIPYAGLGIGYGDGVIDNERMGMRRFFYYNNAGGIQGDPTNASQYYGFMNGFWSNSGNRMTFGGNGLGGSIASDYMFPGDSDPLGWATASAGGPASASAGIEWSEVTEGNPADDRRFCQVAGPFTLKPGAVNNLTVGVVYGRSFDGDLEASVRAMKRADTKAQALFDACFEIIEPPLAPILTIQELENQLVLMITNPPGINIEAYEQKDEVNIPAVDVDGSPNDQFYRFQGYQIYQMINATATVSDIGDITKARLVAQCDIKDGVTKLVNYEYNEEDDIEVPSVKVNGEDKGIRHSFLVTEDLFATGLSRRLVNHKKYYFIAIAYGYNQFKEYIPSNPANLDGQKIPYLSSRQSGTGGTIEAVLGIPHDPSPEADGTIYNTYYGWTPEITQVAGIGNGGNFVKLSTTSENKILNDYFDATPTFANGGGPVNVKVIDPLNVQEGDYSLIFQSNTGIFRQGLADSCKWVLIRNHEGISDTIKSDYNIGRINEQIIPEWGLSVTINQVYYNTHNGAPSIYTSDMIDATMEFSDSSKIWLTGIQDNDLNYPTNWIRSGTNSPSVADDGCSAAQYIQNPCYYGDVPRDVDQQYEKILGGIIAPGRYVGYECYGMPLGIAGKTYAAGPPSGVWNASATRGSITFMNIHDVDIVITDDQEKWTRCVVLEMNDNKSQTIGNQDVLQLRGSNSVNKDGSEDPSSTGYGWFPGYAIDLTTGERLNMAFGENSWLGGENGRDMIWNPTSRLVDNIGNPMFGGMHYVYVFGATNNMPRYDMGKYIHDELILPPNNTRYKNVFENLMWVFEPMLIENKELLSSDVRISIRINKPYTVGPSTAINNGRPMYTFKIDETTKTTKGNADRLASILDRINVVPNPYYAYNEYETGKLDTRVKITNIPERCTITIFNMQGALVRQYVKDDPLTSLDWDLKNHKGIPIAGGVYIIHVDVPGIGEKVIKFYGALRPPDLENL